MVVLIFGKICSKSSEQAIQKTIQSLLLKSFEIRPLNRKLNTRKQKYSLIVFHRNYPKYNNNQR